MKEPLTTKWQVILFLFVGGLNTLFSYALYSFFIYEGFPYYLAVFLSTCLGVLFNFMTTGRIVFRNSNSKLLIKFIGVYAFLYVVNVLLLKLMLLVSPNLYLNGFIAIFPLAAMSFVLNKFLVFERVNYNEIN